MTKKHFIAIAEMFKTRVEALQNKNGWGMDPSRLDLALAVTKDCIDGFVVVASRDNPRFDAARFRAACGV